MKHLRLGVVLLALLLVGMAMVPMVSGEASSAMTINTTSPQENDALNEGEIQKLPDFQPSINDKLSYDEEQRLIKDYVPSPSVPESDMAKILFSKTWFIQNDKDPRSDLVQLTFPETWLNNPLVSEGESIIMLRIPERMLELDDTNSDPELITVSYPNEMFEGFSNLNEMNTLTSDSRKRISGTEIQLSGGQSDATLEKNLELLRTRAIDRQVRAWHQRDTSYSVVTVTGSIDPTSYSNQGETFRNYNEREIYLNRNGDIIEFISDFTSSGQSYAWVAVYDEGTWSTSWNWLNIDVTNTLQQIDYRLYISSGVYDLWLKDTSSGTWYHNSYSDTDNPSTRVDWLTGSTEVDTEGGISQYFRTETNPIRDDWTYSGSTWYSPQTTFDWNSYSSDEQYVYITASFDGSGRLTTRHIAGIDY
jgi:hypothetical protein